MQHKPIQVIPYLSFHGDCEEALQAYFQAFGGKILYLSRWSERTSKHGPEQVGKVMHAEFLLGSTRMSAGDTFDNREGSNAIQLMVHMDTMDEAMCAFSRLAEGGTVLSPLKPHPQPDDAGCGSLLKDRYGFTWIITCPNPEKQ